MSKHCEYCCANLKYGCCSSMNDDAIGIERNLGCTREEGHEGPHVACGTVQHNLAQWENEDEI